MHSSSKTLALLIRLNESLVHGNRLELWSVKVLYLYYMWVYDKRYFGKNSESTSVISQ